MYIILFYHSYHFISLASVNWLIQMVYLLKVTAMFHLICLCVCASLKFDFTPHFFVRSVWSYGVSNNLGLTFVNTTTTCWFRLVVVIIALRPQTPKHIRGGWSHYTLYT
jgi:hypothetical protein